MRPSGGVGMRGRSTVARAGPRRRGYRSGRRVRASADCGAWPVALPGDSPPSSTSSDARCRACRNGGRPSGPGMAGALATDGRSRAGRVRGRRRDGRSRRRCTSWPAPCHRCAERRLGVLGVAGWGVDDRHPPARRSQGGVPQPAHGIATEGGRHRVARRGARLHGDGSGQGGRVPRGRLLGWDDNRTSGMGRDAPPRPAARRGWGGSWLTTPARSR